MVRAIASLLLLTTLLGGAAFGQNPPRLKQLIETRKPDSHRDDLDKVDKNDAVLRQTIERLGKAFRRGDAAELGNCLAEGRIYLSLKAPGDETGYFGRSQVKFMFAKLFRERQTDSFTYDPNDVEVAGDGVDLRARWSYTVLDADEVVTESLRFRLKRSKDDWVLAEIQTHSR